MKCICQHGSSNRELSQGQDESIQNRCNELAASRNGHNHAGCGPRFAGLFSVLRNLERTSFHFQLTAR